MRREFSARRCGNKPPFLRHFILKMIIMPRQARDKHGEKLNLKGVFRRWLC
jgi:hypothetical protein